MGVNDVAKSAHRSGATVNIMEQACAVRDSRAKAIQRRSKPFAMTALVTICHGAILTATARSDQLGRGLKRALAVFTGEAA